MPTKPPIKKTLPVKPKLKIKFVNFWNKTKVIINLIPRFEYSRLKTSNRHGYMVFDSLPYFSINWLGLGAKLEFGSEREWTLYLNHNQRIPKNRNANNNQNRQNRRG